LPGFLDLKGYGHLLIDGALVTLSVGVAAMAAALALGILGALARLSPSPVLRGLGATYATVIRGIPELVLMLLVYYGGTLLLQWLLSLGGGDVRVDLNAFLAGTLVRFLSVSSRRTPTSVPSRRSTSAGNSTTLSPRASARSWPSVRIGTRLRTSSPVVGSRRFRSWTRASSSTSLCSSPTVAS